jgi:ribosome assembly protein SQT1
MEEFSESDSGSEEAQAAVAAPLGVETQDIVDAETGDVIQITEEEARLLDEDDEEEADEGLAIGIDLGPDQGGVMGMGAMEAAMKSADAEREPVLDTAVCTHAEHTGPVYAACASVKLGLALSGGGDDVAYLWDLESGAVRHRLAGHPESIVEVGLNFDGTMAATAALDSPVRIWSVGTGEQLHALEGPSEDILWMKWHHKGNVVLAGSADGTAWMWHVSEATETKPSAASVMQVFAGHESGVSAGCFSPNGKIVCTAGTDSTLRLWKPKVSDSSSFLLLPLVNDLLLPSPLLARPPEQPTALIRTPTPLPRSRTE